MSAPINSASFSTSAPSPAGPIRDHATEALVQSAFQRMAQAPNIGGHVLGMASFAHQHSNEARNELINSAPSRILRAMNSEIASYFAEIDSRIEQHQLQDSLSLIIARWKTLFSSRFDREGNNTGLLRTFLTELKLTLRDPIRNCEYNEGNERALLGSDGEIYTWIGIRNHRLNSPSPYNMRSLRYRDDPSELTVKLHPLVQILLPWIKKYDTPIQAAPGGVVIEDELEEEEKAPHNRAPAPAASVTVESDSDSEEEELGASQAAFNNGLGRLMGINSRNEARAREAREAFVEGLGDLSEEQRATAVDLLQRLTQAQEALNGNREFQATVSASAKALRKEIAVVVSHQRELSEDLKELERLRKQRESECLGLVKFALACVVSYASGGFLKPTVALGRDQGLVELLYANFRLTF